LILGIAFYLTVRIYGKNGALAKLLIYLARYWKCRGKPGLFVAKSAEYSPQIPRITQIKKGNGRAEA
jgi:hypothetical protein